MPHSLLLPKFSPPTRLYLVKVCSLLCLLLLSLLLAPRPAQAQGGGHWGGFPCDAQGNSLPTNTYNNGFYSLYGPQSGTASNTYPVPMINAALAYPSLYGDYLGAAEPSSYEGLGISPQAVSVLGTPNRPNDRVGASTPGFASAENYGYNGEGSYSIDAAHGGPSSGPINGTVTADFSGTLLCYFHMYWSGPGPQPASADFLVSTQLYAQAKVLECESADAIGGLSATAKVTVDAFKETASASVVAGVSSDGVPTVNGFHLVRAAVDPSTGIAEVYVMGTTHWVLSNMVPYATAGRAIIAGGSLVRAGAIPDSRDVMITSNLSTPSNPTYYTDPITHLKVANVRQPDGSMTDDITAPPLTVAGLSPPAGTSATYSGVLSGTWGQNSTYQWSCTLTSPTAFSSLPISGTFNSTAFLGNNTQTIPSFSGTYYNPPASDGKSDTVTLKITDGVDGSVAANTYTVRFHHPYPINYRQVGPGTDIGGGVLKFSYMWDSSTGNLADLSNIVIGETITYDGNAGTYLAGDPGSYTPLSPPYSGSHYNPTEVSSATVATLGRWQDQHRPVGFSATMPQTPGTYPYTGTQTYWYFDRSDSVRKTLAGPYAIVRQVRGLPYPLPSDPNNIRWFYSISKAGSTASLTLGDFGP